MDEVVYGALGPPQRNKTHYATKTNRWRLLYNARELSLWMCPAGSRLLPVSDPFPIPNIICCEKGEQASSFLQFHTPILILLAQDSCSKSHICSSLKIQNLRVPHSPSNPALRSKNLSAPSLGTYASWIFLMAAIICSGMHFSGNSSPAGSKSGSSARAWYLTSPSSMYKA